MALVCGGVLLSTACAPLAAGGASLPFDTVSVMPSGNFARRVRTLAFLVGNAADLGTRLAPDSAGPTRVDGGPSSRGGGPSEFDNGSGAIGDSSRSERTQIQGGSFAQAVLLVPP